MRHAGEQALDRLEPMLTALRAYSELREKKRGTFYRGSRAFIHFHEDPAGLFADVRLHDDFDRFDVTTVARQKALLREIGLLLRSSP
jgi:hypothetical protein